MRRLSFYILFVLASACGPGASAQEKLVHGVIRDKSTGRPVDLHSVAVSVFSFNTVAEAEDIMRIMKADQNAFIEIHGGQTYPDQTGYYEIMVAPTGALIFKADLADPVMELVSNRGEINVILDVGNLLDEAVITEEREEVSVMEPQSELIGNILSVSSGVTLPRLMGREDARLIIQPVLMDRRTRDTIRYLDPLVVDGREYTFTQGRRLNFNLGNDPLSPFISRRDSLTEDKMVIPWSANIYVPDPTREYVVLGLIQMEDYNHPFMYMEEYLASMRTRRPLRFLRYDVTPLDVNIEDYYIPPRREKMSSGGHVSLNFPKNKSELAPDDREGRRQLDSLKKVLLDIANGEGSFLKEFHVVATTSPEGSYAHNKVLAEDRTRYALDEIISVLPKYTRDRVWSTAESVLKTWTDVADLMEAGGDVRDVQRASRIREIVADNPNSPDRQNQSIYLLPYFPDIMERYLPRLREVRYSISYEVNRALTPAEILNKWREDPEYRNGSKSFTLNEYWQLFNMLEDQNELDELYEQAYRQTKANTGRAWELAAAKLSRRMIEKEVIDTSVLNPFIDLKFHSTDVTLTHNDGRVTTEVINPRPLVFNQLVMYLRMKDFGRASQLSKILPDDEDVRLGKALAMCLGGYYYGGRTPEERQSYDSYFRTVCNTSLWNRVVLCLARGAKEKLFNVQAERAIGELPDDDPMKWYFKCIVTGRKGYESLLESEGYLYKACVMDPTLIDLAAGDGDIREDSVEAVREALQDRETGDMIYGYY